MARAAMPGCGDRVDILLNGAPDPAVTGAFPARIDRAGEAMFTGSVTVTSGGSRISGVTSPEADVFVARAGEVVCTPLPKDLIGLPVDIDPGASHVFTARGTIRRCAAGESGGEPGAGEMLPPGRYDVFAVVVVAQADGSAIVAPGGPWPIEVA
jgi:hypothetical protein